MAVSKIMIIDTDLEYGRALARAVSNIHNEFEISLKKINANIEAEFASKFDFDYYDLLLIGGCTEEEVGKIRDKESGISKIVILSEYIVESIINQSAKEEIHFWYIYKYSNANEIISDINYLIGYITGKKSLVRKSFAPEIISFYSISGGTGKSVIALASSRELSRFHDKKVLYLCFEDIPATQLFMNNSANKRNIGDYLYYLFEREKEDLCIRTEGFTSTDEFGVESFFPSGGKNDLNHLTQEELIYFLKVVSESSRYHYIVLDLKSDLSAETMFLINLCSMVIMIQNNDPVSEFKSRKCIDLFSGLGIIQKKDKFILAVNHANRTESSLKAEEDSIKGIKKIYLEKDENSFSLSVNHLYIDLCNAFGIGIKEIAEEILPSEKCRKQGSFTSEPENNKKS